MGDNAVLRSLRGSMFFRLEDHITPEQPSRGRSEANHRRLETHCRPLETHCRWLEANCRRLEANCRRLEANCRRLEAHCPPLEVNRCRWEAHCRRWRFDFYCRWTIFGRPFGPGKPPPPPPLKDRLEGGPPGALWASSAP